MPVQGGCLPDSPDAATCSARLASLQMKGLAAGTVNQHLAVVRPLAYEAADSGLLSPELAAGIRRVKGVKQLGARSGNWLTQDQARMLLEKSDGESLRST